MPCLSSIETVEFAELQKQHFSLRHTVYAQNGAHRLFYKQNSIAYN